MAVCGLSSDWEKELIEKLGFGTWGIGGNLDPLGGYGPFAEAEAKKVLSHAVKLGVETYDTAPPYGNGQSELCLGALPDRDGLKITTKVGVNHWSDNPCYESDFIRQSFTESLERLGLESAYGLLLHSPKSFEDHGIFVSAFETLRCLKEEGLIRKLGVSLKSPADLLFFVSRGLIPDIIQVNLNILDQRLLDSEIVECLRANPCEVMVRTPYAFGFLTSGIGPDTQFSDLDHRSRFSKEQIKIWIDGRNEILRLAQEFEPGITLEEVAMRFLLSLSIVDIVIPGLMSVEEVEQNVAFARKGALAEALIEEIISFCSQNNFKSESNFYRS